jgi:hypothetical protein
MSARALAAALMLVACGGSDDDRCVFSGRYEFGFIPTNGCAGYSTSAPLFGEEECSAGVDQIALNGARQTGFLSCFPGDPVVECEGWVGDSNGCLYDAYVRRIVLE